MTEQLNSTLQTDFFTSARVYLPQVEECVDKLGVDPADNDALVELKLISHHLHSTATEAGLGDSMEAAYGAEQLAEAILSGAMPCDAEALQMFQEALQELRQAITSNGQVQAAPAPQVPDIGMASGEFVDGFLEEARELLDRAWRNLRLAKDQSAKAQILEVRRAVHTFKGSAAMVGLRMISKLAHAMEDVLDEVHDGEREYDDDVRLLFTGTLDALAGSVEQRGEPTPDALELISVYESLALETKQQEQPRQAQPAQPPPAPPPPAPAAVESPRHVRVSLEHLDASLHGIGEFTVIRSGWDGQLAANRRQLDELALAIRRCQRIAQRLDNDYAVYSPGSSNWNEFESGRREFDALEFDRYTEFHLLSRDLSETASDLMTIEAQLSSLATEFDSTRNRYSKACVELQENILHMRMAPASLIEARLERTVRLAAVDAGKDVGFRMEGADTELDKASLEALTAPLEHMLRNAVSHGIEDPETRAAGGKPPRGQVSVAVSRDGSNAIFQIRDDGAGIDQESVRSTAIRMGLVTPQQGAALNGKALFAHLFEPGFSTAGTVSQLAGRGVGLNVVQAAVESLKGTIAIESTQGAGTTFTIRMPLSQLILRVLFVEAAQELFAIPLSNVLRAGKAVVIAASDRLRQLTLEDALHLPSASTQGRANRPAVVLDCGSEQISLLVSRVLDIREVLVRPPSGLLKKATAVAGTTTLADGRVVLVLQPTRLAKSKRQISAPAKASGASRGPLEILVIDDSVSVRRVVTATLRGQGWNVTAAKDGLEALEVLHAMTRPPDAILVDVEMPRMDGYDFMVALRAEPQFANLPAIMLTSRGGDKHRKKAFDVGVTDFLVKPYTDEVLVAAIQNHASKPQAR